MRVPRAPVFCRGARQSLFIPRRRSGKAGGIAPDFPLREFISDLVRAEGVRAEAFDVSRLPECRTANRTAGIRTPDQNKTAIQVHWMAVGARPNVRGGKLGRCRFLSGLQEGGGTAGNSGYAPSPECACNERDHKKDEENDEQELCDACSGAGDAAKAKQSSDDRQYEKCQRPTEHACLHFLCPAIQAVHEVTTPVIRKRSGKSPHQVFCLHRFP